MPDEYDLFVEKFKPKRTTDDCYTPENIYNAVRDWVCRRYGRDPETVLRPFWPGADYQKTEYPDGSTVIDNPPFSIFSLICKWYQLHGIRFFLFAPGLTCFNAVNAGCAVICVGASVVYENGAVVNTSFVTNLEPSDIAAMSCPELYRILDEINTANRRIGKKQTTKLRLPDEIVTAAKLNWYSVHNTEFAVKRSESLLIRNLDNYGKGIFGNGLLLAERAAAERAAAERVELSDRERALQKMIGRA